MGCGTHTLRLDSYFQLMGLCARHKMVEGKFSPLAAAFSSAMWAWIPPWALDVVHGGSSMSNWMSSRKRWVLKLYPAQIDPIPQLAHGRSQAGLSRCSSVLRSAGIKIVAIHKRPRPLGCRTAESFQSG